jgi:hypothetical protein
MRFFPIYPPTQKATVFETADECMEGTLRSSYERSGVCFGGFRPTKHVEEPRASARGGSTVCGTASKGKGITGKISVYSEILKQLMKFF